MDRILQIIHANEGKKDQSIKNIDNLLSGYFIYDS